MKRGIKLFLDPSRLSVVEHLCFSLRTFTNVVEFWEEYIDLEWIISTLRADR